MARGLGTDSGILSASHRIAVEDVAVAHPSMTAQTPPLPRLARPFREFIATQNSSAVVLFAATVTALLWANSPWSSSYRDLWDTQLAMRVGGSELALDFRHFVNDGLMAFFFFFFFFVTGLEIRREFDIRELRERRRLATPVVAALGGLIVPPLIFLAFNAGESTARGWGVVMGTDTAFALGVLALVGGRWAPSVRAFLLTLVIVDDIVALAVVALAYTEDLVPVHSPSRCSCSVWSCSCDTCASATASHTSLSALASGSP